MKNLIDDIPDDVDLQGSSSFTLRSVNLILYSVVFTVYCCKLLGIAKLITSTSCLFSACRQTPFVLVFQSNLVKLPYKRFLVVQTSLMCIP